MSAELDYSKGRAAIALRGGAKTAWHGEGQEIAPDATLEEIEAAAGLDFSILETPVQFQLDGKTYQFPNRKVLARSDTGAPLSITSEASYNVHQPRQILEFFRDFMTSDSVKNTLGKALSIETAGALRGGRIIWVQAKLPEDLDFVMPGKDKVASYLRLDTSFDCTRATSATYSTVRQVCANTMRAVDAEAGEEKHKVYHSQEFDAKPLQAAIGLLGAQHKVTAKVWNELARRKVSPQEAAKFFCEVVGVNPDDYGKLDKDGKTVIPTRTQKTLDELAAAYVNGPGAELKSAKGTAFGLLNAVTYYVDHKKGIRDVYGDGGQVARLNSSWLGSGATMKEEALWYAADLVGLADLIDRVPVAA